MASDLRAWLHDKGLDRYADAFAANGIDLDVLADLSDAELTALGVSLGDRKRLARALQQNGGPSAEPPAGQADPGGQLLHGPAERRWVTVLFCDLVGSTELSDRLDPEELRELISTYQDAVVAAIVRFRGYVGNFRGDGIIAYFGWPRAYEDQAERAVRAALASLKAVGGLSTRGRPPLRARIGISTGQVVINDIVTEGVPLTDAVGRTPNLAARLQAMGNPDEILIDEPTRQEIGRHFRVEPLQPLAVKGLAAPIAAWRVLTPEPVTTRFQARAARDVPLIGRSLELSQLIKHWDEARRGAGRVVLLSGEAGVGKSRLLEALGEAAAAQRVILLRYQCSELHGDTPLHPIVHQLERFCDIEEGDSEAARWQKLEAKLAPFFRDNPDTITLIADLLSLDIKGRPALPDEPPTARRERLWTALVKHPLQLSKQAPVLVVIEDVHWIDPSTQDLAIRFFRELIGHKILLVATQRTPFGPEWMAGDHVTNLALHRLDEAESTALAMAHAGAQLSPALIQSIASRADGVPLFIEEIIRAVVERGAAGEAEPGTRPDAGVPATLQASLTSRLDHLESAKTLAQIGSVIGRQFPVTLLAAVAERNIYELAPDIERLLQSGLVFARSSGSERMLSFKHALVQDAAYAGLLHPERRRLHAAVLRSLEQLYPSSAEIMGQTLAVHAERAGDWQRAAKYLFTACVKAIGRSANREAISLYHRADEALRHVPVETAAPMAIDLRLHAFHAFHIIGDNDKNMELVGEAERLAEQIGDRRRLAAAASESAFAHWIAGEHAKARARGEAGLALARSLGDVPLILSTQWHLANIHHAQGDIAVAIDLHRQVIGMLPGALATKRFGWGGAPGLFSRAFLAWYLIELGEFEQARQVLDEGFEMLSTVDQPFSRVLLQWSRGLYEFRRGEFGSAASILAETLELSRTAEVLTMYAMVAALLGQALIATGRTADAFKMLSDAVDRETYRFGGKYVWIHLYQAYAEARYQWGDPEAGHAELRHALHLAESCGEVVHYAYGLKLLGDFRVTEAEPAGALEAYGRALAIAEPRGVRPLAAHCKWGMARCARLSANPEEAMRWANLAREDFARLGLSYWEARVSDELADVASGPAVFSVRPAAGRSAS
jgi:class 3 adenylate cyclase/tetratricopeptide (TPR) repeat protein